jgi:hypothetical protein
MSGLIRFGYRDYLPEIGKWTAKDPIYFGRLGDMGDTLPINPKFPVHCNEAGGSTANFP